MFEGGREEKKEGSNGGKERRGEGGKEFLKEERCSI